MIIPTSIQQKAEAAGIVKLQTRHLDGGFTPIADEYDPRNPNIYDELVKPKGKKEKPTATAYVVPISTAKPPSTEGPSVFGLAMLKKMGWNEGKGLGRDQQGIVAPLVTEQIGPKSGVIIQGKTLDLRYLAPKPPPLVKPSKKIRLQSVGLSSMTESELEDNVTDEAAKSGNLVDVRVSKTPDGTTEVICEYETLDDSAKAVAYFNGFSFKGSPVIVCYV